MVRNCNTHIFEDVSGKVIFLGMKESSSFDAGMAVYLNIKFINLFQTSLSQVQVQVKEQT